MNLSPHETMTYLQMKKAAQKERARVKKHGRLPNACRFCGENNYRTVSVPYKGVGHREHQVCNRCHPGV